jgi:hypothetical protein
MCKNVCDWNKWNGFTKEFGVGLVVIKLKLVNYHVKNIEKVLDIF